MERHLPISGSLGELDVASILALMHRQALDGRLKVSAARFTKTVWLQEGCIVFAQSTLADDALGSYLLGRGAIDAAELEKARLRMQKNHCRLGRALMEMGRLTPERLWSEVGGQMRAIVFSLFPLGAGRYDILHPVAEARESIQLRLPVPEAILEGVRAIRDEEFVASRFEPGMALYPAPAGIVPGAELKPHEAHVLSLVGGGATLEEVVERSELLRFDTLKVLYALRVLGRVSDRRQPGRAPTPHAAVPASFASFDEALQSYNAKFEYIYRVLSKEIGPVAHAILVDSITAVVDSIPPCFRSLEIRADGRLEERSVLKGVWHEDFAGSGGDFLRGLEEILYAEIFAVKRHLGREHESLILQWIRNPGN